MSRLDDAFKILDTRFRNPDSLRAVAADHERRILDLEKQVAELRAALEEHLNPRTRKPRKSVDPNIYGSMLHD
jgi:hypothetical protein